jgi:hypothetical protein
MSKKTVRNCDYYPTPTALVSAFKAYCAQHPCINCKYRTLTKDSEELDDSCNIFFAYDKHCNENKYRPYTEEEAEDLLGKILRLTYGGKRRSELITYTKEYESGYPLINGYDQEELMGDSYEATVDNKPFGVLIEEPSNE